MRNKVKLNSGKYKVFNIEKEVVFYHSCVSDIILKTIKPSGYYEKVLEKGGCPRPLFDDIRAGFRSSDIPEASFSLSEAGALLGGIKSQCEMDKDTLISLYITKEKPDIDISDCPYDFYILEEVRYRREIPVDLMKNLSIDGGLVKQINECYGSEDEENDIGLINEDALLCIKEFIEGELLLNKTKIRAMTEDELDGCMAKGYGLSVEQWRKL